MALHIISNTIAMPRLQSAINQVKGDGDVVILGSLKSEQKLLVQDLATANKVRCYQLDDADSTSEITEITAIGYDRFVELTVAHKNSVSWY